MFDCPEQTHVSPNSTLVMLIEEPPCAATSVCASAAPPGPVVAARLGSTAFHDSAAPGTPLTGATTAATVAIGADVPAASKRTVTGALELVYPHTADR